MSNNFQNELSKNQKAQQSFSEYKSKYHSLKKKHEHKMKESNISIKNLNN